MNGDLSREPLQLTRSSGSQLLTGLLMTLPLLHAESIVNVNDLKSKPI